MASFLDVCRFTAVSNGTGDFVVSSAVTGYQTPASAGAVNAAIYRYRAESADLSQWEIGYGAYTVGSVTLARTTIVASSTGSKVSFSAAPQVAVVALSQDILIPAVQSDMETGTSITTIVVPGVQKYHPAHPKAVAYVSQSAGTYTLQTTNSFGVSGISKSGTGIVDVTLSSAFSSTNYGVLACANGAGIIASEVLGSRTVTNFRVDLRTTAGANTDSNFSVMFFGDQ